MLDSKLVFQAGFTSLQGPREDNQDFVGIAEPSPQELSLCGAVFAVADGMGGPKGGRAAAEMCMHVFMEAWYELPETLGMEQRVDRALGSANRWIHAVGSSDTTLAGMGTTFSALILRGRRAHLAHVGDSRIYRLRDGHLELLTHDHTHGGPNLDHVLYRAVGMEPILRTDYAVLPLEVHDRFLLCSDGLHTALRPAEIARVLSEKATPNHSAGALAQLALERGSQDNITALVVDIVALPRVERQALQAGIEALPVLDLPSVGQTVDGFRINQLLAAGHYSSLFRASRDNQPLPVVLKFPHPRVASEREYHDAFLREAWIGSRVKSPHVGEILEQRPGRQSRLYSVMPYYHGKTLEQLIQERMPISIAAGIEIALKLCKAAHALHRQRIIHRDIKPDNVLLTEDGGLRLLDLGIARLPAWDEDQDAPIPGTPSYMAPELFLDERGSMASDVFAVGVTLYRMFSGGAYPYGEIEPFSTPRFAKPTSLAHHRPDLPAWLDTILARAIAVDPSERFPDAIELAFELETGLAKGGGQIASARRLSLYERSPLTFWKMVSLGLLGGLMVCLYRLAGA